MRGGASAGGGGLRGSALPAAEGGQRASGPAERGKRSRLRRSPVSRGRGPMSRGPRRNVFVGRRSLTVPQQRPGPRAGSDRDAANCVSGCVSQPAPLRGGHGPVTGETTGARASAMSRGGGVGPCEGAGRDPQRGQQRSSRRCGAESGRQSAFGGRPHGRWRGAQAASSRPTLLTCVFVSEVS